MTRLILGQPFDFVEIFKDIFHTSLVIHYLHQMCFEKGNLFLLLRASSLTSESTGPLTLVLFCADTSTRAYKNTTVKRTKLDRRNIFFEHKFFCWNVRHFVIRLLVWSDDLTCLLWQMSLNWSFKYLLKVFLYIFKFLSAAFIFVYLIFHIRPKTIKISSFDEMNETKLLIIRSWGWKFLC